MRSEQRGARSMERGAVKTKSKEQGARSNVGATGWSPLLGNA
jgi:hypothetical protein